MAVEPEIHTNPVSPLVPKAPHNTPQHSQYSNCPTESILIEINHQGVHLYPPMEEVDHHQDKDLLEMTLGQEEEIRQEGLPIHILILMTRVFSYYVSKSRTALALL